MMNGGELGWLLLCLSVIQFKLTAGISFLRYFARFNQRVHLIRVYYHFSRTLYNNTTLQQCVRWYSGSIKTAPQGYRINFSGRSLKYRPTLKSCWVLSAWYVCLHFCNCSWIVVPQGVIFFHVPENHIEENKVVVGMYKVAYAFKLFN